MCLKYFYSNSSQDPSRYIKVKNFKTNDINCVKYVGFKMYAFLFVFFFILEQFFNCFYFICSHWVSTVVNDTISPFSNRQFLKDRTIFCEQFDFSKYFVNVWFHKPRRTSKQEVFCERVCFSGPTKLKMTATGYREQKVKSNERKKDKCKNVRVDWRIHSQHFEAVKLYITLFFP